MTKKSMFMPHPDGEQLLITLSGCVLLAGDAIFGNPTETTPQGRTNAMRLVERTLQEAEKHGFTQSSTVWALMRRNNYSPRLKNLVQAAVERIPNDVQAQVMQDTMDMAKEAAGLPFMTALKNPGKHEPETNPRFTRPGPDGVDPRFWEAGRALKAIREEEGKDAIHKPEHAHLYAQMLRFAPEQFKREMTAMAKEMDLMPTPTHVGEDGQAVFSSQQIAEKHGISVEEVERLIVQADIDPEDLYSGKVFPIQ